MRTTLLLTFYLLLFSGCNSSLKLTSKIKQTVYPGLPTGKTYTNYVLNYSVHSDKIIRIDSVIVFQKGKCYKVNSYLLKKETSASYSKKITQKGNYILEIPLKEDSIGTDCKNQQAEISLYYKEGSVAKNMYFDNFVAERKTKR
tara:strand:+ start:1489 stop:1920 length:432 start_codon:yes stop_codon:yes gene_type:complete